MWSSTSSQPPPRTQITVPAVLSWASGITHLISSTFGQGHCAGTSTQTRVSGQRYAEQGTSCEQSISKASCASEQGLELTSISLCSPVVGTRRSLSLLPSGVFTLEHLLEETPKLCSSQLTEQQDSEDCEVLGHASRHKQGGQG